jgi:hypothetical protein
LSHLFSSPHFSSSHRFFPFFSLFLSSSPTQMLLLSI